MLQGYNVTVGGGMGMTHNNKKTYPQVAKILGFCTPEQVWIWRPGWGLSRAGVSSILF